MTDPCKVTACSHNVVIMLFWCFSLCWSAPSRTQQGFSCLLARWLPCRAWSPAPLLPACLTYPTPRPACSTYPTPLPVCMTYHTPLNLSPPTTWHSLAVMNHISMPTYPSSRTHSLPPWQAVMNHSSQMMSLWTLSTMWLWKLDSTWTTMRLFIRHMCLSQGCSPWPWSRTQWCSFWRVSLNLTTQDIDHDTCQVPETRWMTICYVVTVSVRVGRMWTIRYRTVECWDVQLAGKTKGDWSVIGVVTVGCVVGVVVANVAIGQLGKRLVADRALAMSCVGRRSPVRRSLTWLLGFTRHPLLWWQQLVDNAAY